MNPKLARLNPMRPPHWRYLRVVELMLGRPQPGRVTWDDDRAIRRARRMFTQLAAARSNEALLERIQSEFSDEWHAHVINYASDSLTRQMLQANLLLADRSVEEIAERFATTPLTIQAYSELYFDVADRRTCETWIHMVVRGDFDPIRDVGRRDLENEARGYVLRLLALRGGRLVLDAAISGLGSQIKPKSSQEVSGWFENALSEFIRIAALGAGLTIPLDQKNAMRLIKLALNNRSSGGVDPKAEAELHAWTEKVVAVVEAGNLAQHTLNPKSQGQPNQGKSPFVESSVSLGESHSDSATEWMS